MVNWHTRVVVDIHAQVAESGLWTRPKLRGESTFVVHHTAADVTYAVDGFVAKNRDLLGADLLGVLAASGSEHVRAPGRGVRV